MDIQFKNFIHLDEAEKDIVLANRNSPGVRENMFNTDIISKEEHINFLQKLKTDPSAKYFLVYIDKIPSAVASFTFINKVITYKFRHDVSK